MRKLLFFILVSSLVLSLGLTRSGSISSVKASSEIYQGDLILTGNNSTVIEGEFDINGSIIVEDNATLILKNAIINFTQTENYQYNMTFRNPANGNPHLQCDNATITSIQSYWFQVLLLQNSSATVSNSTDTAYLSAEDSSTVTVVDSQIQFLQVLDSAVASVNNSDIGYALLVDPHSPLEHGYASVSDSRIHLLPIFCSEVNFSITNLTAGLFTFWNSYLNSSMTITPQGFFSNVTIRNTSVEWWQLAFDDSSNATITDSKITRLFSYWHCNVWMVNSTAELIQFNVGKVYFSWYLDVNVKDFTGQNVSSANVTVYYPNATLADSKLTDSNGCARSVLMEKMMNDSGSYPVGNYTVKATYGTHSYSATVNMTGNRELTLTLDFVVSEPPSLSILSPENKTYGVSNIPLTFTVDRPASWMGYSLDGQANVTVAGNTTLTGIPDGFHSLVVYANNTLGNMGVSTPVYFAVDTTPPSITNVVQTPSVNDVEPQDTVKVNATVTDTISEVKQVILNYTSGNGTWITVTMTNIEGNVWNASIPAFPYSTYVNYTIAAEDNAGNHITTEEVSGYPYQYYVIPEFPSFLILGMFMIATLLAVIVYRRKHLM